MPQPLHERLKLAIEGGGGGNVIAAKTTIPRRTLGNYMSGESEPKISTLVEIGKATGFSLEWLATGEGPITPDGTRPMADSEIEARLKQIEERFHALGEFCPADTSLLPPGHELVLLKRELEGISRRNDISDAVRARADNYLHLAFDDKNAMARGDERGSAFIKRYRIAQEVCAEAMVAVGWEQPPVLVCEAIKRAMYSHGLTGEGVVMLLNDLYVWANSIQKSAPTQPVAEDVRRDDLGLAIQKAS